MPDRFCTRLPRSAPLAMSASERCGIVSLAHHDSAKSLGADAERALSAARDVKAIVAARRGRR